MKRYKSLCLLGLFAFLLTTGCSNNQEKENKEPLGISLVNTNNPMEDNEDSKDEATSSVIVNKDEVESEEETSEVNDDMLQDNAIMYTEDGIIQPAIAKELISELSKDVIKAIAEKDVAKLASKVHPKEGVRFSPYTYVSTENDRVLSREDIIGFFEEKVEYIWGVYDGIGDDIRLTPSDYYKEFIYQVDYQNAEQIGYNEILSKGNMLINQFEVYKDAIVVEYYFSGFKEEYGGADWRSLRLVYQEYEGEWLLVGIIHNQWTV